MFTHRLVYCASTYVLVILGQFFVNSCPMYEFQYPCHTDVCSYPEQYCSSVSDRCEHCKFECNNDASFPLGCMAFCNQDEDTNSSRTTSLLHDKIWFIATTVLPFIFLGIMAILWFKGILRFGRQRNKQTDESEALVTDDERSNTESGGSLSSTENVKRDDHTESYEKSLCEKKLYNVPPIGRDVSDSGEEFNLVTSATPKYNQSADSTVIAHH